MRQAWIVAAEDVNAYLPAWNLAQAAVRPVGSIGLDASQGGNAVSSPGGRVNTYVLPFGVGVFSRCRDLTWLQG